VSRIFTEARFIENSPTHGALWVDAPSVDSAQVQFGMKRRFGNLHRWISGWGGAGVVFLILKIAKNDKNLIKASLSGFAHVRRLLRLSLAKY
jgi:hypothetical protein